MIGLKLLKGVVALSLFVTIPCVARQLPPPYDSIEVLPPNYHGWFCNGNLLHRIFRAERIHTVIEVGSWLGESAMWMADQLPKGGKVYAVDHWLGSPEHQPGKEGYHDALPHLYEQFLSNVIHRKLARKIVPVRLESTEAAEYLKQKRVKPDLIYIDASHDYESVKRDLEAWYPLCGDRTVFCGDDWPMPGVQRAVREFAAENNLRVQGIWRLWRLIKRKEK